MGLFLCQERHIKFTAGRLFPPVDHMSQADDVQRQGGSLSRWVAAMQRVFQGKEKYQHEIAIDAPDVRSSSVPIQSC